LGVEAFLALGGFLEEVVEKGAEFALAVAQRDQAGLVLLVLGQRVGGLGILVDGELHGLEEAELGLGGELGAAATALAATVGFLVELGEVLFLFEGIDHGVELLDDAGLGQLGELGGLLLAQIFLDVVHAFADFLGGFVIDHAAQLAQGVAQL